jgi:phospholipid N-methyltransferase
MIYVAQLRMQLERSFSPLACDCAVTGDHSLTVKLYHPVSGQVDLVVSGLSVANLRTPESVAALIEELRYELESNTLHRREMS